MILTYHEGACVRISAGDTTLVLGPISKQSKNFKPTNFGADVAFVPLNNPDMNGVEEAGRGEKVPFAVTGPGEYEVSARGGSASGGKDGPSVTVSGFPTKSKWGGNEKINTAYSLHFDGLSVLYLGVLGSTELPSDVLEMDSPDILIIPIGGNGVLSPAEAAKLSVKLEAKIIIPVMYDLPAQAGEKTLKQFLKESGDEKLKPVEKLTVKPRDVVGKENEVVVLST